MKKFLMLCLVLVFIIASVILAVKINKWNKTENLIKAVNENNLEMVKKSIRQGADVNADIEGSEYPDKTILSLAVEKNNIEIVRELVKAGAKSEGIYPLGADPFSIANKNGNNEMVRELLKTSEIRPDWNLQRAAAYGELITVQELLKKDDVIKDAITYALFQAVEGNHIEIVRELIKAGADVNYEESLGETPLYYAVENDNKEIYDELIKAGTKNTPKDLGLQLHKAVKNLDFEEVKKLVEQGADINLIIMNKYAFINPLAIAINMERNNSNKKEASAIVEFLKSKGAKKYYKAIEYEI